MRMSFGELRVGMGTVWEITGWVVPSPVGDGDWIIAVWVVRMGGMLVVGVGKMG